MLSIKTNLSSLIVQSNLLESSNGLNRAIERMTTGFKINGAKDNAAGYSIAEKMSSRISSYDVALDNTLKGLDMLETAISSLELITSHLQRIRDLSEQASNGTYDGRSYDSIQSEADARTAEIVRLIENTEYNGIRLFEGEQQSIATGTFIQEVTPLTEEEALAQGYTIIKTAEDLDNIRNNLAGKYILMNDIDLSGIEWDSIGEDMYSAGSGFKGELNGNGYVIKNLTANTAGSNNCAGLFGAIDGGKVSNLGLEDVYIHSGTLSGALAGKFLYGRVSNCYSTGEVVGGYSAGGLIALFDGSSMTNCYSEANVSGSSAGGLIGAGDISSQTITNSYATGNVTGVNYAGGLCSNYAFSAFYDYTNCYASGRVEVTGSSGVAAGLVAETHSPYYNYTSTATNCYFNTETTGQSVGDGSGQVTNIQGVTTAELNQLIAEGVLPQAAPPAASGASGVILQVGIESSGNSQISFTTGLSVNLHINVSSPESARNSLRETDELLALISAKQTELGSVQNRLESVIESIGVSIENTTSSLSTIRDADIAEESSEYIKMQILQQASATLLATANQTPEIALQLL